MCFVLWVDQISSCIFPFLCVVVLWHRATLQNLRRSAGNLGSFRKNKGIFSEKVWIFLADFSMVWEDGNEVIYKEECRPVIFHLERRELAKQDLDGALFFINELLQSRNSFPQ